MNKQELANKIWESANRMRSKIEANEYKDYILGFIFYKFLSDKEIAFLKKDGYEDTDIQEHAHENNEQLVDYCQQHLGYFIAYDNLFSTWLAKGNSFTVDNVRTALSAFNRLISENQKKVFSKIFNTLETGLSKLGDSTSNQTKAISELIQLIKDIPTDGKQDYDVLGFIYEYLISNFAANAGKKAGEFYTPHEVSQLMSEIVANHLKTQDKIEIYDPTSGSGSLLITIGKSVSKYMKSKDDIMYYAQELKENTYNLTRMNLVMRGIKPDNIFTRCGDTLEQDWPMYDDATQTYTPLYLDAVVSNPPYSQRWDPKHKDSDPRYRYGIAPKGKADYAFLLHDLYHIKPNGIMTIVLPHGVLFRGDALGGADGQGEGEGRIRRNLIENNNIEAIIGLPANIFFGTGIPTIIMVLRQKREESDVLFIDASKGFTKVGKTNKLMASDIKKIVDAVATRPQSIEKFARLVSKEEIRRNGYNLNIPRYIDSSDAPETWDIYATMFGGVPNHEIDLLAQYWNAFPQLRSVLFAADETPYRQRRGHIVYNIAHADEMVHDLHDVVHLGGLKRGGDPVGAVDFFNLLTGQAVTGHAAGAVGQIHLYVFVDAKVVVAFALIEDLFYQGCRWGFSYHLGTRLRCPFRYHPPLLSLYCTRNFSFLAIAANHLHRDRPQRRGVFCCVKLHNVQSFQSYLRLSGKLRFRTAKLFTQTVPKSSREHLDWIEIFCIYNMLFYPVSSTISNYF